MNRTAIAVAVLFAGVAPLRAQSVRDSAGVRIISYPLGAQPATHWTLAAKPAVEIGGVDGVGPTEFSQIMGAVRLSNGNIVVANMQTNELRFFDPAGKFIKAVGRSGGGPGEFSQLMGVKLFGETLQASDGQGGPRIFSTSGAFVRQIPASTPGVRQQVYVVLPDGSLIASEQEPPTDSLWYTKMSRVTADGRTSTTLMRFPVAEMAPGPPGRGPTFVEFRARSAMALFADRFCRGFSRAYEIACYRFDGTPTFSIRRTTPTIPVSDSARKAFEVAYTDVSGGNEGNNSDGAKASLKALRLRNLPGLVYAKTLPMFASFLGSRTGEVWVRDFRLEDAFVRGGGFNPAPTTTTHWNVFASDGRWIADITLPARFTAFDAGTDYVLGVSRDTDDVERVTMLRLQRN